MHDTVQSSRTMQSSRKIHEKKKTNIMNNVVGAGGNKMLGSVTMRD